MLVLSIYFGRKQFHGIFSKTQIHRSEHIFSVFFIFTGMDAQVAYGFHNLRNEKPYLAQGPIANKVFTIS